MKIARVCVLLLIVVRVGTEASQTKGSNPSAEPAQDFARVARLLRQDSEVPLRLPGRLPNAGEKNRIFLVIRSVTKTSYDVLLATELPCDGQNVCLYGSVQAVSSLKDFYTDEDSRTTPVVLARGIKGQFIGTVCRAYCTQAYARWREGDYFYSVGIKAAKMDTVIRMANSAIESAP